MAVVRLEKPGYKSQSISNLKSIRAIPSLSLRLSPVFFFWGGRMVMYT